MARDPNAPPYHGHRYERVYKPARDSVTRAEARRRRRDAAARVFEDGTDPGPDHTARGNDDPGTQ